MNEKIRVSARQRMWFTRQFAKKNAMLPKDRMSHTTFLKSIIGLGPKEIKDYSTILFGSKGDSRNCERDVLEKCLAWIGASFSDFLEVDKQVPNALHLGQGKKDREVGFDFFTLAAKHLGDAISKGDKERLDETLHLLDAVIFTQPSFSVSQIKSVIFSIGEFLHMSRDRPIPSVSESLEGYGFGWYRLWLWMKRMVSVLRLTADKQVRDVKTGTMLWLFIPWCEIIGVKMLRHKLFMKVAQNASKQLIAEIRTTIRHSFLESLCDGAEYYLFLCGGAIDEVKFIRQRIPSFDEYDCRANALHVLGRVLPSLKSKGLNEIKMLAQDKRQVAEDIIQARIVLGLIMENWGRYLCYSTDGGDKELLELLITSAEACLWTETMALTCKDILDEKIDCLERLNLPVEPEFVIRMISLVSDIHFLRARQMDAWKCCDRRLEIRKTLQSACDSGMILKGLVDKGSRGFDRANLADDKIYGDLARKVGYYARYWFDEREYFEERKKNKWLPFFEDEDESALVNVRFLFNSLHLHLPWDQHKFDVGKKADELLDKLYWDFEMELWLEYDLLISNFERCHDRSGWCVNTDKLGGRKFGVNKDVFNALAELILLYSEMTWPCVPSTENSSRLLIACRQWATKKLRCDYYEPRCTKMNPAELLKLALGTFLRFENDPNGERNEYSYQRHGTETPFIGWARSILAASDSSHNWTDEGEALRTFIEIVTSDFIYLLKFIDRNFPGNKEWWYLKKILKRKGEVPYPWNCEEDVRRCSKDLGCVINQTRDPKCQSEQAPQSQVCVKDVKSIGYVRLCNWIGVWRPDLKQLKDISVALGISDQCLSYLRAEKRVENVSAIKRQRVIEYASDILGVEYSEILEEISDERIYNGASIFGNLDYDTEDGDKRLERFIRALRNTRGGGRKWGYAEDMAFYEEGLSQYFINLKKAGSTTQRKTYDLFCEWRKAKYDGMQFLNEIKLRMKECETGSEFYGKPSVARWFRATHFSGVGDAVNILKLGFVGLEFLAVDPKHKIGQEPLRDIIIRCGDQLQSAKPDWDGTKVLNEMMTDLKLR